MEKQWKLYVHKNNVNDKVYVGITSKQKPEHRWNGGRGYMENPHFYSAIQKYGWGSFEHIILYDGLSEHDAKEMEKHLIAGFRANDPKFGYNMTTGGDGTPGCHPTDETRAKLSKARMKENLSDETLKRRSDGLKGRVFSEQHKRKIGQANSKPVDMYDKDGTFIRHFDGATSAEREVNISHSHISQCCNGQRNSAGGYVWRFTQYT